MYPDCTNIIASHHENQRDACSRIMNMLFFRRYASESIGLACNYAYKDVDQDSTLGGKRFAIGSKYHFNISTFF